MVMYVPGKTYVSDSASEAGSKFLVDYGSNLTRGKRVLASDEYSYYHNFLNDPKLSDAQKAGIAIVLMADLNRWAGTHRELVTDYTSPEILQFVEMFEKFPEESPEKAQARFEISNFDKFLLQSQPQGRGILHSLIEDTRKGFAVRLAIAKRNKSVEELLKEEREEQEAKEYEKEMKEQAKVISEALETHMRSRIREYLSLTFDESVGKLFIDKNNSKREYAMRMDIIKRVQNKTLNPVLAIAEYKDLLEEFAGFLKTGTGSSVLKTLYSHPMTKQVSQ